MAYIYIKKEGKTVSNNRLFHSVKRANALKTIPVLIGLGVNPYETDDRGRTLLHYAAEQGNVTLVNYLLNEVKIKPNVPDYDGQTAMHFAASQRHVRVVKALSCAGGDVNAADKLGLRPLHIAAIRGHLPMVSTLVRMGADIFATSFSSRGYGRLTAREAAILANQPEMARVLGSMEKKTLAKMAKQAEADSAPEQMVQVAIVICSHGDDKSNNYTPDNQNIKS